MRQLQWLSVKLAIDCLRLVRVQRVCSAREKANKEIRIKGILSAHAGHLPLSQLCTFCHGTLLGAFRSESWTLDWASLEI